MTKKKGVFSHIRSRFERNRLGELLVQRGKMSSAQLHLALDKQKETGQNLGTVVTTLNYVSKNDIRTSLLQQAAYRAVAASLTIFIGLSAFGIGSSSAKAGPLTAKSQFSHQAKVYKAAYGGQDHLNKIQKAPSSQDLFGTKEVASNDISAFKKWTGILNRLDKVSFDTSRSEQFRGMGLSSQVVAVNEYVNKFRYIEDKDNFGKNDYWATPSEFFARGGDCEDFAIAKYAMLKNLGVPENKMRLAIVQDKIKNIPHAVLIVYTDTGPMLLDNQMKSTKQVASVDRYKPIYSINATGWWRHLS